MADQPDQTDRKRLQEGVHQTDLTESRVNEDFVDWLKTKGPTYLLIVLIGVSAYLAMVRWRQHKSLKVSGAWAALDGAALPESKVDVADQHAEVFGVVELALNSAGSQLLRSVQQGRPIDITPDATDQPAGAGPRLNDEERRQNLERADAIFARLAETDDGSMRMTLHALQALNGRAAIAEAEGRPEDARALYEQAAERAAPYYPVLATQARARAADVDAASTRVQLSETGATAPPFVAPYAPASIVPALRDLLARPVD